jgi:hypothetical protein
MSKETSPFDDICDIVMRFGTVTVQCAFNDV